MKPLPDAPLRFNHPRVRALRKQYGICEGLGYFRPPIADCTEHFFHEIGHALSLGIDVEQHGNVSMEIPERLGAIDPFQGNQRNESVVLLAEWRIYRFTPTPMDLAEVRRVALDASVCREGIFDAAIRGRRSAEVAVMLARFMFDRGVLALGTATSQEAILNAIARGTPT